MYAAVDFNSLAAYNKRVNLSAFLLYNCTWCSFYCFCVFYIVCSWNVITVLCHITVLWTTVSARIFVLVLKLYGRNKLKLKTMEFAQFYRNIEQLWFVILCDHKCVATLSPCDSFRLLFLVIIFCCFHWYVYQFIISLVLSVLYLYVLIRVWYKY